MIVLYHLSADGPRAQFFNDTDLTAALKISSELRKTGHSHVSISSEPGEMVGEFGVADIVDGLLPDGQRYEWTKAHRAGMKRRNT